MKHATWIVVTLLIAVAATQAQPGPGRLREGIDRLNLTDTQEDRIEKLRLDHEKNMIQVRARIQEARLDFRSLMRAEKPDRAAMEKAIRGTNETRQQRDLARMEHWLEVRALLTPEQQEIWKELPGRPGRREMRQGRGCDERGPSPRGRWGR